MFSVARFQSKTNEKLICLLEHLSIDVFKLRLGLYGWNPRIHQAPVCDMCQNERFSVTKKQANLHLSRVYKNGKRYNRHFSFAYEDET
jgi:hypothetical protein